MKGTYFEGYVRQRRKKTPRKISYYRVFLFRVKKVFKIKNKHFIWRRNEVQFMPERWSRTKRLPKPLHPAFVLTRSERSFGKIQGRRFLCYWPLCKRSIAGGSVSHLPQTSASYFSWQCVVHIGCRRLCFGSNLRATRSFHVGIQMCLVRCTLTCRLAHISFLFISC